MPDPRRESLQKFDSGREGALSNAPKGGYLPLDLDDDCPWRMSQSTRRKSATVKIGTWVLLGLLAFLVARVLMSR